MSKFVVYQPHVCNLVGQFEELSDVDAEDLLARCETSGHIVAVASDPVEAITLFGKKIAETVQVQSIFMGKQA